MVVKREKSIGRDEGKDDWKCVAKTWQRRSSLRLACVSSLTGLLSSYFARFTSSGDLSLKLSTDSAGRHYFFVAGKCGTARTCATAGNRTNRRALAPTGYPADNCAKRGAAARQRGRTLALALLCAFDGRGFNLLFGPVDRD